MRFKRRIRTAIFAVLVGAAIATLLQQFQLSMFEAYLYDFRVRQKPVKPVSSNVVIVKIDDKTIQSLNELPPLSIPSIRKLVEIIGFSRAAKPKAIALLGDFTETDDIDSQQKPALELVRSIENLAQNNVPVWIGTDVDVTGEVVPTYPLSLIPHRLAIIHRDGTLFSEDRVTRRALFSLYGEVTLHEELAKLVRPKNEEVSGLHYHPHIGADYFLVNYLGPTQELKHHFTEISAADVLTGIVEETKFKDKIVLVGSQLAQNTSDYVFTPYSRSPLTNSKLVVHANIIETLIRNDAIKPNPRWADFIVTFLLTAIVLFMVFETKPMLGGVFTIGTFVGLFAVACIFFWFKHIWIRLAHPLFGVFFAYYFFVPYRLIREYQKRSQAEKDRKLLLEVEELKRNFLSLITHDLKTPVARIQGIAEVFARTKVDPKLTSELISSSEELNRFISSILELNRLEQKNIRLELASKDINRIIENSLEKFHFSASQKHIEIVTHLEPMFPIKIDAGLIAKVISNLVDNAIKYSPENSKIIVESMESRTKPGFVEVKVTDFGFGINEEEKDKVFKRFFRSKNVQPNIKGTGLGLYLSRYFVIMHHGELDFQSNPNGGTTFFVFLPVEVKEERKPELSRKEISVSV
ncbi:MAG: CHASE2 domain-containing protein [Bacteriovoracia bacterium]